MEDKVVSFDNSVERYLTLAEKYIDAKKYEDALKFLFCALKKEYSSQTLSMIAVTYADMGLYFLSNKYWIKYLDAVPENCYGDAFEELGINFFYMDNYFLANYYFNKKINVDGYLRSEKLTKEIIDYFTRSLTKRNLFRIVYPVNIANFLEEITTGRKLIAEGNFKKAIKVLGKIPNGAKEYYEATDYISLAEFLLGNYDKAIELTRKIVKEKGESVSTNCNLSTFYKIKGDKEKSRYYYDRAISLPINEKDVEYKLATCSLEQGEHLRATSYLEKVLEFRVNDMRLTLLMGIAHLNAGNYNSGKNVFLRLNAICPDNPVYSYYLHFAERLLENDKKYVNLLPLEYDDDLPRFERDNTRKRIDKYFDVEYSTLKRKLKTKQFNDDVRWTFLKGDDESIKTIAFLLVSVRDDRANKIALDILIDMEVSDSVKGALLFALIVHGYNGKVGISCGNFYNRIKIRKLSVEDDEDMDNLFIGYALLMTKLAFMEIDNFDKVGFSVNKIYKKFKGKNVVQRFKKEELASLVLYLCNYVRLGSVSDVASLFKIKKERLDLLISLYNGVKNDKNS